MIRWAPLHFKGSYWDVAEDELDVVAAYYRLQACTQPLCAAALVPADPAALMPLIACPGGCNDWVMLVLHCLCTRQEDVLHL